jgi:secreted PhoX family phosphatase
MDRRSFLKSAATAAAAAVPFRALLARAQDGGIRRGQTAGYGPLFPTPDRTTGLPLLLLPEGFKYVSFGWRGDLMSNGSPTPSTHDGMAAFPAEDGLVRLVRNHEVSTGTPFSSDVDDPAAGGGTTTLVFDSHKGELIESRPSLSGTIRNCAGGPALYHGWPAIVSANRSRSRNDS